MLFHRRVELSRELNFCCLEGGEKGHVKLNRASNRTLITKLSPEKVGLVGLSNWKAFLHRGICRYWFLPKYHRTYHTKYPVTHATSVLLFSCYSRSLTPSIFAFNFSCFSYGDLDFRPWECNLLLVYTLTQAHTNNCPWRRLDKRLHLSKFLQISVSLWSFQMTIRGQIESLDLTEKSSNW